LERINSRALVTGAASGIGRACATLLNQKGWYVALADIDAEGAARHADELGEHTFAVAADVADRESVARMTTTIARRFGGQLDLLINSAGVIYSGNFVDQSVDSILRILSVNAAGVALCTHAAFPLLQRSAQAGRKPTVVNLSSASAIHGIPGLAVYAATKFLVRGLTEALAIEWAPHGIAVRDVMPLFVETPMATIGCADNPFHAAFGSNLSADAVAEQVYRAAHDGPLHRHVSWRVKATGIAARLLPGGLIRHGLAVIGGYAQPPDRRG
jgi:NAD(P)-dependent dehydrogenase (short-subunit alcohol dehydrogenase family)